MSIKESYNSWADQYDTNNNKTRDVESIALRKVLSGIEFDNCLEVGCGTGKNTIWLMEKASNVLAIDFSEEMLKKAKEKISSSKVEFKQVDITQPWPLDNTVYDLVSFSLVLEHIANLDHVFSEACKVLKKGGYLYVGELHPFKQYSGSKAKFDTVSGTQVLECFTHHVSDFIQIAKANHLSVADLDEHFDDDDSNSLPRILTMLFQKH
jgi:ubiquinone/menaquinone biosynthesis C-methylase UbiE